MSEPETFFRELNRKHAFPTLAGFLPNGFVEKYLDTLPPAVMHKFEKALNSIYRWKDQHWNEYGQKEVVLDHIKEMLVFVDRIEKTCPALAQAINLEELRLMIILHDIGEIEVGDTTYTLQGGQLAEVDETESDHALLLIQMIKNEEVRDAFIGLYARQRDRAQRPNDKEAHMLKFLDVTQGELFGMNHVFPERKRRGVGYKGRDGIPVGDVPDPSYFVRICKGVINALGDNEAALSEFRAFADITLFHAIKHYPLEDIERIRKEIGY